MYPVEKKVILHEFFKYRDELIELIRDLFYPIGWKGQYLNHILLI